MTHLPKTLTHKLLERKQLRRPSGLQIALADRIGQLNPGTWRAVTGGRSFFFSLEYLEMLQAVAPENLEPRYALICDQDRPLAALCMQIVRVSMDQLRGRTDGGGRRLARTVANLKDRMAQRVLVCGNLLTYGMHAVCFAEGVDPDETWHAVAEALYRLRRQEKLAGNTDIVLIKDLGAADKTSSSVLSKLSYGSVETEPNMVLTLDRGWSTHEDYLASLTSKYRSDIKQRVLKRFESAGFSIEELAHVAPHAETLHALYLQVHGGAALRPFTLRAGYWEAIARTGGSNVVIHVARSADRVVGFILTLRDGDTGFAYHIGFDRPTAQAGVPVYLRLLHASVEQGIRFGCRRLSFGRTALEPKARLGCKPEETFVWARHRHPVLNQLIRPLLGFIQHEEAPELEPFKKTEARSS